MPKLVMPKLVCLSLGNVLKKFQNISVIDCNINFKKNSISYLMTVALFRRTSLGQE